MIGTPYPPPIHQLHLQSITAYTQASTELINQLMMKKLFSEVFKFLQDLDANNQREWFNENKTRFQDLQVNILDWIAILQSQLAQYDEKMLDISPKNALFRIHRDARFSKGKAPYKTHFGIHLVSSGNRSDFTRAGFYIHIEPGASYIAGGAHAPSPEWLKSIRTNFIEHGDEFLKIIHQPTFKKYLTIKGEQLVRPPKGYSGDEPFIDLLKYKTLIARHELTDKIVCSDQFILECMNTFNAYKPFRDFLNRPALIQ